ncbi:MAG TPA: D-aminoacyl-tRNA deacylase [Spirochaetota bacterium]|jgi:D-tyrosyl-tRNA(Tyr) deacylase|nr:D-aminoacyl-tRNA deacylase [Spirochaetota bacterium]HPP95419.1 D-aminoacyl-tRNA deacylase [Spirochaetota bacterium]
MRAVVQRVKEASVEVDGKIISKIGNGLLVFVGINHDDTEKDSDYIITKCLGLRIFEDDGGLMNLSLCDVKGQVLVVSQFTLYGDARKGRRPSFSDAMKPDLAAAFFDRFVAKFKEAYSDVFTGEFQSHMEVKLINSGPVTILLDSKRLF